MKRVHERRRHEETKLPQNFGDLLKNSARGSLILLVGQVTSTIILAVGILFVARVLGSSEFGLFNIALAPVTIATLFQNLGIQQALVKFLAQYRHEEEQGYQRVLIETGTLISLTSGVLITLILYLSAPFLANSVYHEPQLLPLIRWLSVSVLAQSVLTVAHGVTIGYERMGLRSITQIVYSFIKSIVSPLLVVLGFGVTTSSTRMSLSPVSRDILSTSPLLLNPVLVTSTALRAATMSGMSSIALSPKIIRVGL